MLLRVSFTRRSLPTDVNMFRLELEGITVKGKGCAKPIKTWVQCGVSMKILNALKKSVSDVGRVGWRGRTCQPVT